jgi:hypothetical protein
MDTVSRKFESTTTKKELWRVTSLRLKSRAPISRSIDLSPAWALARTPRPSSPIHFKPSNAITTLSGNHQQTQSEPGDPSAPHPSTPPSASGTVAAESNLEKYLRVNLLRMSLKLNMTTIGSRQTCEVCGDWCHRSIIVTTASLDAFFWLLMVWGSAIVVYICRSNFTLFTILTTYVHYHSTRAIYLGTIVI